jgi:AcrR family transcriptional regulator
VAAKKKGAPRKSPRQTRSKALVDAILTAGARVLVERGYARASTNRIADVAGVSVGSLYQYFPSKEALVAAIMKKHAETMVGVFEQSLLDIAFLPVEAAVRGVVDRTFRAHAIDLALHRVIYEQVPRVGLLIRARDFEERLASMFGGYLEHHRAEIRPENVPLAVFLLNTAVEAIANQAALARPELLEDEEAKRELTALLVGYLRKPGETAAPATMGA